MTGRQRRRRKQLLDDLKMRGYWTLKEAAADRVLWRIRFGRVCGLVLRQTEGCKMLIILIANHWYLHLAIV